jgi:hypothetical protein
VRDYVESLKGAIQLEYLPAYAPELNPHSIRNPHRALFGGRVTRTQYVAEQILLGFMVESDEAGHEQVTPRIVMAVEERQLLASMSRIVCRVHVKRDVAYPPTQSPTVPFDHTLGQCFAHSVQIRPARNILKTRQCRLRGKRCATQRIASDQKLLDRVLGQPRSVIAVSVPAGDPIQPLPHQIPDRVRARCYVSSSRSSHAFNKIAPPSELA